MKKLPQFANFWNWVKNKPHATALYVGGRAYSYSELGQSVTELSDRLESIHSNIGVVMDFSYECYVYMLACFNTGFCYIPLNPSNPIERNMSIIHNIHISGITGDENALQSYVEYISTHKFSDLKGENIRATETLPYSYVMSTSGSSGFPKLIGINVNQLEVFFENVKDLVPFDSESKMLQLFNFTFDASIMTILLPLFNGNPVYDFYSNESSFLSVPEFVREHKITHILMVPSLLNKLEKFREEINLPELSHCMFGGEALQSDLLRKWAKHIPNADFYNFYGPTEATIWCSAYVIKKENQNWREMKGIVSIGKPFKQNIFRLNDEEELEIAGEQVIHNYINPGYEDSFDVGGEEGFYKTGDKVTIDGEDYSYFLGRIDNQLKVSGYRFEAEEVESVISSLTSLPCIVMVENGVLICVLEGDPVENLLPGNIPEMIASKLPYYMVPSKFLFGKVFPRSASGKVLRKKLFI